jgi:3',5'-cyclic AMP phosphodiesterase CpdA
VTLDTSRAQVFVPEAGLNDFGGKVEAGQMRWLENTLKANQKKTIIVLTHHSAVPWCEGDKKNHNSWGWFRMDNGDEVRALFKKYGVKAVSGHRHISTGIRSGWNHQSFIPPFQPIHRFTVYDMTKRFKYEVKDVPAGDVWELARRTSWQTSGGMQTNRIPQRKQEVLDFYESN